MFITPKQIVKWSLSSATAMVDWIIEKTIRLIPHMIPLILLPSSSSTWYQFSSHGSLISKFHLISAEFQPPSFSSLKELGISHICRNDRKIIRNSQERIVCFLRRSYLRVSWRDFERNNALPLIKSILTLFFQIFLLNLINLVLLWEILDYYNFSVRLNGLN